MITKELFQYFKEIKANADVPIAHEKFLPIRKQISIAAASNYILKDEDDKDFWLFFDKLIKTKIIKNVHYVMEDLWTEENNTKTIEELFYNSEDAYLKYILFESDLPEPEVENKVAKTLSEKFSAECFINDEFGTPSFCITWD